MDRGTEIAAEVTLDAWAAAGHLVGAGAALAREAVLDAARAVDRARGNPDILPHHYANAVRMLTATIEQFAPKNLGTGNLERVLADVAAATSRD